MIELLAGQTPRECRTFSSDLRIKVSATGLYTYPDCGIFCGKPVFSGDQKDVLLNPLLSVEVLSPSTENYDRGKKFGHYRTIESFREYLIVHQDSRHVEHHSKQEDGSWVLREYTGDGGPISITRLGIKLSLAEIYAPVQDLD
jgi:Uma2 family endonuclease